MCRRELAGRFPDVSIEPGDERTRRVDASRDWPRLRLQTVARALAMRWLALAGLVLVAIVAIALASRATRPQGLDVMSCPEGSGGCQPMVVPPAPNADEWLYVLGVLLALALGGMVLAAFGPASQATLRPEGQLALAGGILPQQPVDMRAVERVSVGALAFRGLLFIHCGRRFPVVMLAPVDGTTRLVAEARQRGIVITLDGL